LAIYCKAWPVRQGPHFAKTAFKLDWERHCIRFQELRARQLTPQGRVKLRERVAVEHTLAHVGHWQGDRARYRGQRKNLFDLRRRAVVQNLHVISHAHRLSQAPAIT
jgi:transposase